MIQKCSCCVVSIYGPSIKLGDYELACGVSTKVNLTEKESNRKYVQVSNMVIYITITMMIKHVKHDAIVPSTCVSDFE